MNSIEREILKRKHEKKRNKEGAAIFGSVMGFLAILAGFAGVMAVLISN